MKVEFWTIGKTAFPYLDEGLAIYEKRLSHYLPYSAFVFPDVRNSGSLSAPLVMKKEGEAIFSRLRSDDFLVLLDENGRAFTSVEFAGFLEQKLQLSQKRLVFLIGGAWGFAPEVHQRADFKLSLSKMTFSHQMVRLFFLEQLYRAMTILKGEKYHNEN